MNQVPSQLPAHQAVASPSPAPAPTAVHQPSSHSDQTPASGRKLATTQRVVFALAGVALIVGFVMPWVKIPHYGSLTGFELTVSNNAIVEAISTTHRGLFAICPVAGAVLLALAVRGYRITSSLATLTGLSIIGLAMITLAALFVRSTSLGLWLVLAAAFATVVFGAVPRLPSSSKKSSR